MGHHGMVWADCENGAVTRFLTETDPAGEVTLPPDRRRDRPLEFFGSHDPTMPRSGIY
jgi:hypothetical protein